MKTSNEKKKIAYIVGLIILALVSSLIVIVALANPFSIREYLEANVRQELLYMLLIFLLLLPVLMLVLAISLHVENKKGKEPEIINVNEVLYKDTEADNDTTEAETLKELVTRRTARYLLRRPPQRGSTSSALC